MNTPIPSAPDAAFASRPLPRSGAASRPVARLLLGSALLAALACTSQPPGLELPEPGPTTQTPARAQDRPSADGPEPAVAVETVTVIAQHLRQDVVLSGELRAAESVALRAETAGRVIGVGFEEGQAVRAGQLLVKINDAALRAEKKRSSLRRDLAAQREQRLRKLVGEGTVSQDLYDEAANQLAVLEAELELFDARIALTEVRAPFEGVVGLRAISLGSYLTPQTVITTVQDLDPIKIDVTAAERYAGRIHLGTDIHFTVAGVDHTFTGRVYALEQRIDTTTRTVLVRARAANPGNRLMPGAFAKVRVTLDASDDALMVPSTALVPGLAATTVFVVENGVAAERKVRTGTRTARDIEILEGLAPGDRLIISGIQSVRQGTPVSTSDGNDTTGEEGEATAVQEAAP